MAVVEATLDTIREKVEADPTHPRLLVTVWGVGYRWEDQ